MGTFWKTWSGPTPFENNHADPWAKTFLDVPSLNASVTETIASAITQARAAGRKEDAELRTSSVLVLGPAGAGKTHLFSRLRHKLGPKAVFVHLRPLVGTEMTPRYVLGEIVKQLGYDVMGQSGLKQLEALVGSSLAILDGESPDYPRTFLDEVMLLDEARRAEKLEAAVEQLLARHQEADETYLARLLDAPFMKTPQQRAALAWLAGRELEESQMKRLGVSASLPEERIVEALQTLAVFAAPGAPIVLVFDQLENLVDPEGTGVRIRAYANLVAELFDATRGVVLVQLALDSEWERAILPQLSTAQRTRLGGTTKIIALPTADQIRELVGKWTQELPDRVEDFPWPFGERRVTAWSHTPGMTPRMLMTACRQALMLGPDAPLDETHEFAEAPAPAEAPAGPESVSSTRGHDADRTDAALAAAWDSHLTKARRALDEAGEDRRAADVARLAGGVACAMALVGGFESTRVDAKLPAQIQSRVKGGMVALGILHQTNPRSAITALERLTEAASKGAVTVLRERALEFPPTWKKVQASVVAMLAQGVRWRTLERDDAANLLALESFVAASRSRDLEDGAGRALEPEVAAAWLARTHRVEEWAVVRALHGEPADDSDAPEAPVPSLPPPSVPAPSGPVPSRPVPSRPAPGRSVPSRPAPTASRKGVRAGGGPLAATIRTCLAQLRVVSLERLVREVVRVRPEVGRAEVVAALDELAAEVQWFGRTIVVAKEARS